MDRKRLSRLLITLEKAYGQDCVVYNIVDRTITISGYEQDFVFDIEDEETIEDLLCGFILI